MKNNESDPLFISLSLKRPDIKCQKGLFYGGRSREEGEATIAEIPKNHDAAHTLFLPGSVALFPDAKAHHP